jgi:hypothetical protein
MSRFPGNGGSIGLSTQTRRGTPVSGAERDCPLAGPGNVLPAQSFTFGSSLMLVVVEVLEVRF